MHKVQIAPSAEGDLLDGYAFYELQDPGIGDYFLQSLASDIESLGLYAGIYSKSHLGLYRTASKRFPFSVYYHFDGKTATVAAVLDARRNPKTLRRVLVDRHLRGGEGAPSTILSALTRELPPISA